MVLPPAHVQVAVEVIALHLKPPSTHDKWGRTDSQKAKGRATAREVSMMGHWNASPAAYDLKKVTSLLTLCFYMNEV
jgi:hypothetical protein